MVWVGPPPRRGVTAVVAPTRSTWPQRLVPYAFIALDVLAEVLTPRDVTFSSTLSVAPALAALLTRSLLQTVLAAATAALVSGAAYAYSRHLAAGVEVAAI